MSEPLRVLFIEDSEEDVLKVLRQLRHDGFDVIFKRVETGEALVTTLKEQTWDIVLSGYYLPRFSITEALKILRENGVDVLILDCDGNIDELLPIWIDCGINGSFPLECASGMDARKVRKKFGENLVLFGNIDKRYNDSHIILFY